VSKLSRWSGFFLFTLLIGCRAPSQEAYIFGNRIPQSYFITWGQGESDVTEHAGSYDEALRMAKIENYNIMTYSSIMPPEAKEIPVPETYHHGAVLESINAVMSGKAGETLTVGLIYSQLRKKLDHAHLGGFVAEYHGNASSKEAEENLRQAMQGIFDRRYNPNEYELYDTKIIVKSFVPKKKFGTILVVMGFADYIFPQVKK
jgi:arginine decarboxylase